MNMTQDTIRADHDYLLQMKTFPCTFNLESVGSITLSRLRYIKHNLITELEIGIDSKEELIRKKNLLTMVEFRLGDRSRAQDLNDEVISLTNWTNIPSLGNRCFIMVSVGDEPEAKRCLRYLKQIRKCQDKFDALLTEANAEQAYCYSRLGGSDNLRLAINLFTLAVSKRPDNYLWKFGLGLVYRRATHTNIYCSSPDRLDVEEFKYMAAEYLFDVGENAESSYLRAMAYAQLVKLRQDHPFQLFPQYDSLFRYNNIHQLCDKALEHGRNIPCVLTQCGRSLKSIDLDRAIDLLERSVTIKRNTISYHNLGICYKRKAELLAQGQYAESSCQSVERLSECFNNWDRGSLSPTLWENTICDITTDCEITSCEIELEHFNGRTHQIGDTEHVSVGTQSVPSININEKLQCSSNEIIDFSTVDRPLQCSNHQDAVLFPRHIMRSISYECITDQSTRASISPSESCNIKQSLDSRQASELLSQGIAGNSRGPGRVYNRSLSEGWSPREEVKAFVSSTAMSVPLNINDILVQKAISCYKCAIELSNGENLPASLDLGIILKQTGQVKEALTQFNCVTNSQLSLTGHRVTVISAYEQAGLCYLELSKTDTNYNSFDKDGQKKLTKAISLAADLAITISELKDCAQDVWVALRTLLNELDIGPDSLNQQKQKIKLLELVRDHGQVIEVVQKLRQFSENQLDDQNVIRSALTSYLKLGQPEHALAFQNMVSIGHGVRDSTWWSTDQMRALRASVLLQAISGRLKETKENPTYLFQQLFQLCQGSCVGMNAYTEDEQKLVTNFGDILVVYDEDQDSDDGPSSTMKAARYITNLSTSLFGLEAKENLQGTGEYGALLPIQLKEMRRYQVVILMLGCEPRNRLFDAMLEMVSYNKDQSDPLNQRIVVVDAGLKDNQVPICLKQYDCLKLEDVGCLEDIVRGSDFENEDEKRSYIKQGLGRNVDAILKLFCCIIGQKWPCP